MEEAVGLPGGTKPFQHNEHGDWPADTATDVSETVMLGCSLGFTYRYWILVDELASDCNVEVRFPDQGHRGLRYGSARTARRRGRFKQASSTTATGAGHP